MGSGWTCTPASPSLLPCAPAHAPASLPGWLSRCYLGGVLESHIRVPWKSRLQPHGHKPTTPASARVVPVLFSHVAELVAPSQGQDNLHT